MAPVGVRLRRFASPTAAPAGSAAALRRLDLDDAGDLAELEDLLGAWWSRTGAWRGR